MTNYLIIDTTDGCIVGKAQMSSPNSVDLLEFRRTSTKNSQLEDIPQMFEALFSEGLQNGESIDEVLVSVGPSSYTGLRVGLAFAKAVGIARHVRIRGYSTLDLVARHFGLDEVVFDAKRQQKFVGKYSNSGGVRSSFEVQDLAPGDEFMDLGQDTASLLTTLVQNVEDLELPPSPIYLRNADAVPNIKPPVVVLESNTVQNNTDSLKIEPVSIEDLDEIIAIEHAMFPLDSWTNDQLRDAILSEDIRYLKAVCGAEIVGTAIMRLPIFATEPYELESIGVIPEFRRRKIANRLMDEILSGMVGLNTASFEPDQPQRVVLTVRESNFGALGLYKKFGFKKIDVYKKYYYPSQNGANSEDAIVMERVSGALTETADKEKWDPIILGIESSCDETGIAFVQNGRVLGGALSSSMDQHKVFGGVIPEVASRAHLDMLEPVLKSAISEVQEHLPNFELADISAVSHASAPGLVGCLMTGAAFAQGLAASLGRPFYAVNHVIAHIMAAGLEEALPKDFLALIVSGGHTSLVQVSPPPADSAPEHSSRTLHFEPLGGTLDDAAGEAFDKVGRLLGLDYPAGPLIDKLARKGDKTAVQFPRPLTGAKFAEKHRYDFSFSGLKTAAIRQLEAIKGLNTTSHESTVSLEDFCASFAEAVADVLTQKVALAIEDTGMRTLVIGGGFSANSQLREKLGSYAASENIHLIIPSISLCTDNGEMVANLAEKLYLLGTAPSPLGTSVQSSLGLSVSYLQG
jgi:N6-L-threonylcarbamoyladenine synthase